MQATKLLDLSDKVELVTGGSRGIGFQMAEALGEMGAKLAISARKQSELDAASEALKAKNIEVMTVANDLATESPSAAESLVGAVLRRYGKIDVLVNNAGTAWGATGVPPSAERWWQGMGRDRGA